MIKIVILKLISSNLQIHEFIYPLVYNTAITVGSISNMNALLILMIKHLNNIREYLSLVSLFADCIIAWLCIGFTLD
jgi:hypothetical protein